MEQWTPPMCGALRISNPKTLKKWMDNGKYQEYIDDGWIFNKGCGRFRTEVCACSKCRTKSRPALQELIDKFNAR